jgi:hypothetical protein
MSAPLFDDSRAVLAFSLTFNNSPGTDAAGADLHGLYATILDSPNLLQVGVPYFTGFIMCMANIVAGYRFFAANFTCSGHCSRPPEYLERV